MRSALAMKLKDNQMLVFKDLKFKEPKTKDGIKILEKLKMDSALIVALHENKNLFLTMQNIPKVKAVDFNQVNIYDVLNHKWLVFTQKAYESFMEKIK